MKLLAPIFVFGLLVMSAASPAQGSHRVKGYVKKDGTYVPSHRKTNADGRFSNNWSTKGNFNPFTGKSGTRVSPPRRRG